MATGPVNVIEEDDDLLTCSICLETFKAPKYLPCLHTFCKLCINTYIQSFAYENRSKGFECPVCRTFVLVGEHSLNLECWAEELPNNQLIISLIDRKEIQKLQKLCNACKLSNVSKKAVSWCIVCQEALCSACENCHRKFNVSSRHKILTLQEVQEDKTGAVFGLITCEDHSDKFVEIYCLDHSKPCCTVCAAVKHRKCEGVVAIEEAAVGVKQSKKTTELLKLVMQWKKMLEKSIKDTNSNLATVEIIEKYASSEYEKLWQILINMILLRDKVTKNELAMRKEETVALLANKMAELSTLEGTVDNWHRILSTCIKDGSDIQCLVEVNKLIPLTVKIESKVKDATVKVERKHVVEKFQEIIRSLGELRTTMSKPTMQCGFSIDSVQKPKEPNFCTGKVKTLFTLDAGCNEDECLSGVFIEDFIFITNFYTGKLLKFNFCGVFQCDLKLNNFPYDITKYGADEIAVSVPYSNEILLININRMSVDKIIKLSGSVYGLRYIYVNDQFIVVSGDSDIVIMWLNATNGQTINKTETSAETYYICATESNSYVYADGLNSVSCLSNSSIKFTYTNRHLSSPRGIDVDFHGNFYVCSSDSNTIHQISESGKLISIIPCEELGIVDPWVIRFKPNSNTFLVTSFSSRKVVVAEIIQK